MGRNGFCLALAASLLALTACERGGSAPPGAASAKPAKTSAVDPVVRDFRLGLDELKKELAEKGEILRDRPPAGAMAVFAAGSLADLTITSKVKAGLQRDPEIPAMSLEVETHEGRVTLTGRAGSWEQLQHSLLAALKVPEVRTVVSKILVEPDDGSGATKG